MAASAREGDISSNLADLGWLRCVLASFKAGNSLVVIAG